MRSVLTHRLHSKSGLDYMFAQTECWYIQESTVVGVNGI